MKIVKEKLELGKAMENNNSNMKKIDGVDTVVAVDPGYAKALSDEEKAEKHTSDVMEETDKAAEGITPEDPKTGKALPKTAYTKQEKVDEGLELDESLFEDIRKVDTLPNDVYTLVYDLLFPGLNDSEKKPHLVAKEEEITVPEEKSFIDLEGADIGVQIKSEEDEGIVAYVKKIAEILGLETYEKKVPGELKYGDHILAIKIPEELSEKNATEFLANLGIDEEGIRGKYKIKEAYGQDEIRGEIGRYFDYAVDGDFVDVVEDIIDRVDDPRSTDDITQAIDDGLIYTSDQWTVLEHYCTPQTANWEDAIDEFINDIYHIVDALNKSEDEEEDEETEVEVEETDESLKEGKGSSSRGKMDKAIDIVEDLADTTRKLMAGGNHDKKSAIDKAIDDTLIYDDDIIALGWYFDAIDTHELLEGIYPQLVGEIEERIGNDDKDESLKEGNECKDLETAVEDCFWEISSEGIKPSKSEVCNRVVDECGADRKEVRAVVNKLWGKMTSDYNDDMVANGAETINHRPLENESLKESRFPRFELEIWVPGSGGDDERERTLIKTDDIDEVLETVYKTKLDSGEAFLFTDVRRNFQLDQEYSREQLFDDIKDRLGDEYDLSGWDEYFVETNAVYDFEESKKCEEKECEEKLEQTVDGYIYNGVGIRKSQNSAKETIWSCEGNVFPTLKDAKAFIDKKQIGKDKKVDGKELTEDAKVISSLSDFKPWSGAEATWDKIMDANKFDELDAYIEEMYPDGIDETDLNDLLWFDGDSVLEALGISEEDETDESLSEDKENPELDKKNNKNIGGISHL